MDKTMKVTIGDCSAEVTPDAHDLDASVTALAHTNMQTLTEEFGASGELFAGARVSSMSPLPSGSTLSIPVKTLESESGLKGVSALLSQLQIGDGFGFYNLGVTAHMFKSAVYCLPNRSKDLSSALLNVRELVGSSAFEVVNNSAEIWVVTETLPHDKCASSVTELSKGDKQAFVVIRGSYAGSGKETGDALLNSPDDAHRIAEEMTEKACATRGLIAIAVKDAIVECLSAAAKQEAEHSVNGVILTNTAQQIEKNSPKCIAFSTHTTVEYANSAINVRNEVTGNAYGQSAIANHGPSNGFTWIAPESGHRVGGAFDWYRLDSVNNGFEEMSLATLGLLATTPEKHELRDVAESLNDAWSMCTVNTQIGQFAAHFHGSHGWLAQPVTWSGGDDGALNVDAVRLELFPSIDAFKDNCGSMSGTFAVEAAALNPPGFSGGLEQAVACTPPGHTCVALVSAQSISVIESATGTLSTKVLESLARGSESVPAYGTAPTFEVPAETVSLLRKQLEQQHVKSVQSTAAMLYRRARKLHESHRDSGNSKSKSRPKKMLYVAQRD